MITDVIIILRHCSERFGRGESSLFRDYPAAAADKLEFKVRKKPVAVKPEKSFSSRGVPAFIKQAHRLSEAFAAYIKIRCVVGELLFQLSGKPRAEYAPQRLRIDGISASACISVIYQLAQ